MEFTLNVFRGGPDGRITKDTVKRALKPYEVYIQTTHSGLCGTDEHYVKTGSVLGHEGVGIIKSIGEAVKTVKVGDRVGFGYFHEICGNCDNCATGWDQYCRTVKKYGSADTDNGSFSSGAVWDEKCVYPIPDGYESKYAAPLMCGGATVWTVLSQFGVRSTHRVAIMGIGGLGHMAIKLAAAMGYTVVVLSSSESKRQEAMGYGASEFHVFRSGDKPPPGFEPVKHLLLCGSAAVDWKSLILLMDTHGVIYPLTVDEKASAVPLLLLDTQGVSIQGSLVGGRNSIKNLLKFAADKKVAPTIMEYPLTAEGIEESLQDLRDGKVRYRAVLVRQ